MKTILTIAVALFFYNFSFSQDTTKYVEKYDNGVVKRTGLLIDGNIQISQWRVFYPSGNIKSVYEFINDTLNGKVTHYYENSQIRATGLQYDLDEEGEWRTYYESGEIKSIVNFKSGNEDGELITFYKNGNKKHIEYYENGVLINEKAFFINGNVDYEYSAPDKGGVVTYKGYYETGELSLISHELEGKDHGEWISYNKDGSVSTKGQYENDLKTGTWYDYDDKGRLASTTIYKEGQKKEYTIYKKEQKILTFRIDGSCDNAYLDMLETKVTNKPTTKIGQATWMTSNLDITHFINGDKIYHAKTIKEWVEAAKNKQPAWCYPDFDSTKHKIFGKLYNWYAANDPRGLAPNGWQIPSEEDWEKVKKTLGGENRAGIQLRANCGWKLSGSGANSTGMSILPGKKINQNNKEPYGEEDNMVYYWTSTIDEDQKINAYAISIMTDIFLSRWTFNKGDGLFIRCIKP